MSSKFLEDNKQALHVAAEVIALLGVSVYFSRQNRALSNQINELKSRLEEQHEIISRHEHALRQHTRLLQELQDERETRYTPAPKVRKPPRVVPESIPEEEEEVRVYQPSKPVRMEVSPSPKLSSPKPIPKPAKTMLEEDDVGDIEDESELDAELENELNELNLETSPNE